MKKSYVSLAIVMLIGMMCGCVPETNLDRVLGSMKKEYGLPHNEAFLCFKFSSLEAARVLCKKECTTVYEGAVVYAVATTKEKYQGSLLNCIEKESKFDIRINRYEDQKARYCRAVREAFPDAWEVVFVPD